MSIALIVIWLLMVLMSFAGWFRLTELLIVTFIMIILVTTL